jgi:methionine biosynthesis protein MetW
MELNDTAGYDLILNEIPARSRVLDLGCGEGDLLALLVKERHIEPHGVEISQSGVASCVEKGLYVSHGDIDEGLSNYKDNSFDYVILNQTLQNTKKPGYVLKEIMRIGRHAIISFPNFVYIDIRFQMMFKGVMPTTKALPFAWDESPNIHLVAIKDFHHYCRAKGYPIKKELHFRKKGNSSSSVIQFRPNLFAEYGFFILDGSNYKAK